MVFDRDRSATFTWCRLLRVGLPPRVGDTGRSIKEVEMYLAGLTYREVQENAGKDIGVLKEREGKGRWVNRRQTWRFGSLESKIYGGQIRES